MLRVGIATGAGLSHGPAFAAIINGGPGAPPEDMRGDFEDVRVTCVWDKEPGVAEKPRRGLRHRSRRGIARRGRA